MAIGIYISAVWNVCFRGLIHTIMYTALPLSLANANGTLSKTVKSKLFAGLSKSIPQVTLLLKNTVSIFGGMVLFQKLPSTLVTFGDIGDYLLQKIYKNPCRIAFFVTDFYMPFSIKSIERKRRSVIGSLRIKITNRNQQKPKCWNKYLQHSDNKIELVKFLIDYWSQDESSRELLSNCELYVTYEAKAFCVRTIGMQVQKVVVPELQSEQEEADTKILSVALER